MKVLNSKLDKIKYSDDERIPQSVQRCMALLKEGNLSVKQLSNVARALEMWNVEYLLEKNYQNKFAKVKNINAPLKGRPFKAVHCNCHVGRSYPASYYYQHHKLKNLKGVSKDKKSQNN